MDNRIRFPSTLIDFQNEVGITGQDHDYYPKPGQARYDWMRMTLIGLLANQSSEEEPFNYRPGTIWYKLTDGYFRYCKDMDTGFVDIADGIKIEIDGVTRSLSEWADYIEITQADENPMVAWNGVATDITTYLEIPEVIRPYAARPNARGLLHKNGLLVNPHHVTLSNARDRIYFTSSAVMGEGDEYVIEIQLIDVLL